ncbi:MAG: hypothetical protein EWM47_05595 [Anaerolineaceae bacterium]|nr:MAG: hypothetical protein EWM47_05595 [Anaerolineaceae bacterium]
MQNTVTNVIELLIGAILMGLGLLYLASQYRALSYLTDLISQDTYEDRNVLQQFNEINIDRISDDEIYAAIMGCREYPIMIDDNLIPLNEHDYDLYFTYVRDGYYKKEYQYEANKRIVLILYSYNGI